MRVRRLRLLIVLEDQISKRLAFGAAFVSGNLRVSPEENPYQGASGIRVARLQSVVLSPAMTSPRHLFQTLQTLSSSSGRQQSASSCHPLQIELDTVLDARATVSLVTVKLIIAAASLPHQFADRLLFLWNLLQSRENQRQTVDRSEERPQGKPLTALWSDEASTASPASA